MPNEVLGRIWNLADTEQRGALGVIEFIIAMHLLASYKSGALRVLPQILPSGLYEAAARRGTPPRQSSGSRPTSETPHISAIPRQFSGAGLQRTSSPLAKQPYTTPPLSAQPTGVVPQPTGLGWIITQQEKAQYDSIYTTVDTENRGFITGEQAVSFFSNSRLPEDDLAQIWDLSDINSEGQLNRDEFAVAMYLIRQQKLKNGALPQSLPQNLVPPSLRRQPIPTPQSTAPIFDNAANITKPKSAADDLFGLDAFSTPSSQVAESTGDSTAYDHGSPRVQDSPQQSSVFRPFIPSSSFGQTMMTPQATGPSVSGVPLQNRGLGQPQRQASAMDDLLGDNDPEVSKRLTQETSELANLSNQVGTLTTQMQEVKSKRASTEQDLSQVNSQKRDFEARLGQLRSAYEQEVRAVKTLEDRLAKSRAETKRLQQDSAMIEGTHQDLQTQHQQISAALDSDQRENASLKEKIRKINGEITELKPQLEKTRSDARQQKGLVAINKKQLSTIETERDKVRGDLDGASRELGEANHDLEESKQNLQAQPSIHNPPNSSSPASPTTASLNPFFRRTTTAPSERAISPQQTLASPNHKAFDNFFGPPITSSSTFPSPAQGSAPPPTSFGPESPNNSREQPQGLEPSGQSMRSSDDAELPTPSTSPPRSIHDDFPGAIVPPPPPQSRQITSSSLPFREHIERPDSRSASVKVSPPASRFGDASSFDTPTEQQARVPSTQAVKFGAPSSALNTPAGGFVSPFPQRTSSISSGGMPNRPTDIGITHKIDSLQDYGQLSAPPAIPGAFPGDSTPPVPLPFSAAEHIEDLHHAGITGSETDDHHDGFNVAPKQTPTAAKDDFDSAFVGFGKAGEGPDQVKNAMDSSPSDDPDLQNAHGEFPPIQEFGADDESESENDRGFDDNFAPSSSPHQKGPLKAISRPNANLDSDDQSAKELVPERPVLASSASRFSQPPTPEAQSSPPTYDQTVSPNGFIAENRDSNQFPAEYGGLLPSREDPTSPHPPSGAPDSTSGLPTNGESFNSFAGPSAKERAASGTTLPPAQMPMLPGSSAAPYAYTQPFSELSQQEPPIPPKNAFDDFDDEFGDLSEAREADDKGEEDFGTTHRDGFDEFNPTFDSPAPSKATTRPDDAFHDFESSLSGPSSASRQPAQQSPVPSSHDWDAIFAGLDDTPSKSNGATKPSLPPKEDLSSVQSQAPFEPATSSSRPVPAKPALGRALTSGTEHDDPILKRLTGMGYPRDASLQALERFDYNIDKVGLRI